MSDPRLYRPHGVSVRANGAGVPVEIAGIAVTNIREEWLVEDGWWTGRPLRRHYFEAVLADGGDTVVFREPGSDQWFRQRA